MPADDQRHEEARLLEALTDFLYDVEQAQKDEESDVVRTGDDFPLVSGAENDPLFGGVVVEVNGAPYVLRLHPVQAG
jgi:hypothetical protein